MDAPESLLSPRLAERTFGNLLLHDASWLLAADS